MLYRWSARAVRCTLFEPVPRYFAFIQRLAELNPDYRIVANQAACGVRPGNSVMAVIEPRADNFYNYDTNIGSSSLAIGFLDHARELTENITVATIAFDDYVREQRIDLDRIGLMRRPNSVSLLINAPKMAAEAMSLEAIAAMKSSLGTIPEL